MSKQTPEKIRVNGNVYVRTAKSELSAEQFREIRKALDSEVEGAVYRLLVKAMAGPEWTKVMSKIAREASSAKAKVTAKHVTEYYKKFIKDQLGISY
jgi:ribosomal protein L12E/L44/L45/RPP1/RPP2